MRNTSRKLVLAIFSLLTITTYYHISSAHAASEREELPTADIPKEQVAPSHTMTIPDHPQLNALRNVLTWLQIADSDITGDAEPEQIGLLGMRDDPSNSYYQLVYLIWKDVRANRSSVTYIQGGYQPSMQIGDLDGDRKSEVLVQLPTANHRAAKSNFHLYTIRKDEVVNLPLPQPIQVDAKLEDGYTVILCAGDGKPFTEDLSDRKKKYDKAGLYKDGKLLEPAASFTTTPYHMLNLVNGGKKGTKDLVGVQIVHRLNQEDPIALVQSLWKWKEGTWKLVHISLQKACV